MKAGTLSPDHLLYKMDAYWRAANDLSVRQLEDITFAQLAEHLCKVLGRPVVYAPASIAGYMWHFWRK